MVSRCILLADEKITWIAEGIQEVDITIEGKTHNIPIRWIRGNGYYTVESLASYVVTAMAIQKVLGRGDWHIFREFSLGDQRQLVAHGAFPNGEWKNV